MQAQYVEQLMIVVVIYLGAVALSLVRRQAQGAEFQERAKQLNEKILSGGNPRRLVVYKYYYSFGQWIVQIFSPWTIPIWATDALLLTGLIFRRL